MQDVNDEIQSLVKNYEKILGKTNGRNKRGKNKKRFAYIRRF